MIDQWSNAEPFFATLPTWLSSDDARRLTAYQLYEEMYWSTPGAFKVVLRGDDQNPVYVPTAMALVEATNRYLCRDWTFTLTKDGTDADRADLQAFMTAFFAREEVRRKFGEQKRKALIMGDAVWHIIADPTKPAGSRISLVTVDPGMYFPIMDPYDDDKRIGCHIVEQWPQLPGETLVKRQTYRKTEEGRISYELSWWKLASWDDRVGSAQELKRVGPPAGQWAIDPFLFPDAITQLPVYHVRNGANGDTFGDSEVRGVEFAIASITQAVSDTELSLALEGLGLYVTTSGPPVDDDGNEVEWRLGPGFVAEIDPDADWKRVQGITTVQPATDYVNFIESKIFMAKGVPDIALGKVEVLAAESGIALQLKMDPLLAKNAEKESEYIGVTNHMLYDLVTMWFPTYELTTFGEARAVSSIGNPLPQNRKAILEEIMALVTSKMISIEYGRTLVQERLGYIIPDSMGNDVVIETTAMSMAAQADPFTQRVDQELN